MKNGPFMKISLTQNPQPFSKMRGEIKVLVCETHHHENATYGILPE